MTTTIRRLIEDLEALVISDCDLETFKAKSTELLTALKEKVGPSPEKYSAQWLKEFVHENGYTRLHLRSCGLCNSPLYYHFESGYVYFDSSCDCTRGGSGPQPRSWEDLSRTLTMQSSDEIRDDILSRMS